MRKASVFIALTLALVALALSTNAVYGKEFSYVVGKTYSYKFEGEVDTRGNKDNGDRTSGSFSKVHGEARFKVLSETPSKDGYRLAMNVYRTHAAAGLGPVGADVGKYHELTTRNKGFGSNVEFTHLKNGEVMDVKLSTKDDPMSTSIKLAAINTFQTHIVGPGETHSRDEHDTMGHHRSNYRGVESTDAKFVIEKTFDQSEVYEFVDANLKPTSVVLSSTSRVEVHSEGHIQKATTSQSIVLSTFAKSVVKSKDSKTPEPMIDDMDAEALDVEYASFSNFKLVEIGNDADHLFVDNPLIGSDEDIVEESLFGLMRSSISRMREQARKIEYELKPVADIEAMLTELDIADNSRALEIMTFLRNYFEVNPEEISKFSIGTDSVAQLKFVSVLANINSPKAEKLLLDKCLHRDASTVLQLIAARALITSLVPHSETFVKQVFEMSSDTSRDEVVRKNLLLAAGSMIHRLSRTSTVRTSIVSTLQQLALSLAPQYANVMEKSGLVDDYSTIVFTLFNIDPSLVPAAAVRTGYVGDVYRRVALGSFENSDMPFNRSIDIARRLGGSKINVDFEAGLFAGTNFNCNQDTFNYEVEGHMVTTLNTFGVEQEVISAQAVYGRVNRNPLRNEVFVKVWGKVVYDKKIDHLDCKEHIQDIIHTAPGFETSYTVFIGFVPISFGVSANLDIDVKWAWSICDADLSAAVDIRPGVTVTIAGKAELNLIFLHVGIKLEANLNALVVPRVALDGVKCAVNLNARLTMVPCRAALKGYFLVRKCKWIFWKCSWVEDRSYTFIEWSAKPVSKYLVDKQIPIKV